MIDRLKLKLYYNLELNRLNLIACFLKFQLMILNIEKKWVLFKIKLLKILYKIESWFTKIRFGKIK